MRFIPNKISHGGKTELNKPPYPKARLLSKEIYDACDLSGRMIFEPGEEVLICGRYMNSYIMLIDNHRGEKEELLVPIHHIELIL